MFTSGTQALQGRTVNHDPEPWAYSSQSKPGLGPFGTPDRAATRFDGAMLWFPRPEFAVLDNPILAQLRGEHAIWKANQTERSLKHHVLTWRARSFLSDLDRDWKADFTPEQIDHARRVLTRLASFDWNV